MHAFPEHLRYFEAAIRPRLDRSRRFVGPVAGARKRSLLAHARCVLVTSLVPETCSLVALEALASGTPVAAFRRGALPEIVEHGRTGFLVDTVDELAEALRDVDRIRRGACRRAAEERFSLDAAMDRYLVRYRELAEVARAPAATPFSAAARRTRTDGARRTGRRDAARSWKRGAASGQPRPPLRHPHEG